MSSGVRRRMIAVEVTWRPSSAESATFAALANDLTPEAVSVQTFHAIPVGTEVLVQIALPDGIARCEGTVHRAEAGTLTIGFDAVAPADRARIARAAGFASSATA
jgi:hypothetical protein